MNNTEIISWSVSNKLEYDGKVYFLNQGNVLISIDINTYKVHATRLNLN